MAHTFDELKKKTVANLREIAKDIDHEALKGYTQLNKEHLLEKLCEALDIKMHSEHKVIGIDKSSIKKRIRKLKKKRDEAQAIHNQAELKLIRRQIRRLKRTLRKATV